MRGFDLSLLTVIICLTSLALPIHGTITPCSEYTPSITDGVDDVFDNANCPGGVDAWMESGNTVPDGLAIHTVGDSATVTLNTDLYSTEVYMDGYATIIETPEDRLKIQPSGNIIKIFRNGTLEEELVSDDATGHYWVKPDMTVLELRPSRETCTASVLWEIVYVDYDPGTLAPPEPYDVEVGGWKQQYDEDDPPRMMNGTYRNGSLDARSTTDNPGVLHGGYVFPWDLHNRTLAQPDHLNYTYEVHQYNSEGGIVHDDSTEDQIAETVYEDDETTIEEDPSSTECPEDSANKETLGPV